MIPKCGGLGFQLGDIGLNFVNLGLCYLERVLGRLQHLKHIVHGHRLGNVFSEPRIAIAKQFVHAFL